MGATAAIGLTLLGGLQKSQADRQAGQDTQQMHEFNAQIYDWRANDAIVRGKQAETTLRLNTRRMIGSQRAAFAASGVDITSGDSTPSNVFKDTAQLSEVDALNIRANAAREAWGYKMSAANERMGGSIAAAEGNNAAIGDLLGAGQSVLYGKYGFK